MMARTVQSIEVNVAPRIVYGQLTRFEEYPRFMEDVLEVRQSGDNRLHWHTKSGGLDLEWDAEITAQEPERCIAWRNVNGPRYEGKIELEATGGDRTRLTLTIEHEPGQQMLAQHGDAEAMLAERALHDLERFKKFIEKQARDTGQWRGRPVEASAPGMHEADASVGDMIGKAVGRGIEEARDAARTGGAGARAANDTGQYRPASGGQEHRGMMRPPWLPGFLQAWNEPMSMMRRMSEDVDHLFGRFVGRAAENLTPGTSPMPGTWTPSVEVTQHADRFVVCVELAGVRREDMHVEVRNDRLTVEGERRRNPATEAQEYCRSERVYGRFYRVVDLPPGVDADQAQAVLRDGMLEVQIPFRPGVRQGRRLDIQVPEERHR